jgi:hypothetical protein
MKKRLLIDTSSNSVEEDTESKKNKMEVDAVPPILVIGIDKVYLNDPKKLKRDLDSNFGDLKITETKSTAKGDIIFYFENNEDSEKFIQSSKIFKENKKIRLNKPIKQTTNIQVVIKGLSFAIAEVLQ